MTRSTRRRDVGLNLRALRMFVGDATGTANATFPRTPAT
jgi:hypothetical protein